MKSLNAVIVGGASGLGLATARLMLREGVQALGLIDANAERLDAAAASLREQGATVCTAQGDVSRAVTASAAFDAIVSEMGRVHTMVNCAAIYPRRPILEISDEDWDLENAINIKGTYHMMVAAVKHMMQFSTAGTVAGRIVNVASVDAFKAHPQNTHYAATKAAVVSLTKSFAHEFAPAGILINGVAPAGFATDRARELGFLPELAKANPLGRAAEPEEMAEWIIMMGGPRNTFSTGETVIVSGGYIYA
ncbi:SDR family NAD(P)-dependent oxidoreductase [Komagataeibacter sp. FNDCF1]|uniref:SDR family NAD(P)-dependent oxidoreductase n=1 Tax=Komagataeibacter sp. FNDCF1 TaxID=2878681 RepID=UPI001E50AF08|nr:SDR family oxidoreductase [Komagataeibacter sp. FNDCF1]MCE2563316.1 SDR family oxidoreductase [Komagataeibacter sp. FNDCF1]